MISTLLLYPTCTECGGNLPFVSRHLALRARADSYSSIGSRQPSTEITGIECPNCGARFCVQERGLGVMFMILAVSCAIGYFVWGEDRKPGVGFLYFFGGSLLALFVAWLIGHRRTVLTLSAGAGGSSKDDPQMADVFAQLEAQDAQIERMQKEQREQRVAADDVEETPTGQR